MKMKTTKPAIMMTNGDSLTKLIKKCLAVDENHRISWEELFSYCDQLKFSKTRATPV